MKKWQRVLSGAAALAVFVVLVAVEPALAASARNIGRNIGNTLVQWGGALFVGLGAIVALPHLLKRDVAGGLVFLMLAIIVGGFVFYGRGIAHLIASLWKLAVG